MSKKIIKVDAEPIRTEIADRTVGGMLLRVVNDESYERAGALLRWCKTALKEIDRVFDPVVKATREAWRTALGQKNEVAGPVDKLDDHLREELAKYAERKEAARRESEAKALENQQEQAAALEAGEEVEFNPSAAMVPKSVELPAAEGLSFRDVWEFKIVNLDAIPREYLMADEARIEKVVRALMGATNIPGVEVFSRKVPVQR